MQFRHAVGARTLEAHHGDEIAVKLAALEGRQQVVLVLEDDGRRLDRQVLGLDRRGLHHRAAQRTGHQPQAAVRLERVADRPQDVEVERGFGPLAPDQPAVVEEGLGLIAAQAGAGDGHHVVVGEARVEQLADHEAHAAGRLEGVHVLAAVRIDAGDQRGDGREVVEVLPGNPHAGGAADSDQVQGMVGRPAGGQQPRQRVDQAFGVHHLGHGRIGVGPVANLHRPLRGGGHQGVAQGRVGMHEGRTRQVQAGHLHHHLVGVCGAVEGAGAGAVVGGHLGVEQRFTGDLALGV